MTKTKEELNELKIEFETVKNKFNSLSDDELLEVTGGVVENYIGNVEKIDEGAEGQSSNSSTTPKKPFKFDR